MRCDVEYDSRVFIAAVASVIARVGRGGQISDRQLSLNASVVDNARMSEKDRRKSDSPTKDGEVVVVVSDWGSMARRSGSAQEEDGWST